MILDTLMIFLFHMCETSVEHIEILYLFKTLNGSAVLAALGGLASEAELLTSWSSGSTSLPFFPVLSFPLAADKLSQRREIWKTGGVTIIYSSLPFW